MAANVYECMFLLDTSKVAGDLQAADKQLRGILDRHKAEVLVSRPWDERRLAYPIKNQKKALYYLTYFSAEGRNLMGFERDCKLNEMILRQMVIRIEPKLVETMLSLARGEHATALHNIHEEGSEEGGGGATVTAAANGEAAEGEGARRRPRNEPRE
jgi:small subunit ribosomal protein S6